MIESMPSAEVSDPERFVRLGLDADATTVAHTREEFAQWLKRFFDLDAIRSSDLVLAINEALANAVEFAYLLAEHPGTIDVQAQYHSAEQKLIVDIADKGRWRTPPTGPTPRNRGRGIPLMETLSDEATIDTSSAGTRVRLAWRGVTRG